MHFLNMNFPFLRRFYAEATCVTAMFIFSTYVNTSGFHLKNEQRVYEGKRIPDKAFVTEKEYESTYFVPKSEKHFRLRSVLKLLARSHKTTIIYKYILIVRL